MTEDLDIDVSVPCARWRRALPVAVRVGRRAARAAYRAAPRPGGPAEASLVLADDAFVAALNREYRGRDGATNVLSFCSLEGDAGNARAESAPVILGDVVVAYETAAGEAAREGKTLADHLSHLVIHGMLHLLGHDHRTEAEAESMERLEAMVLSGLGVGSPYTKDRAQQ